MNERKRIPLRVETDVLTRSKRRCCLCFAFHGDVTTKVQGQIAHVNRDASDSRLVNLAWLCLNHHDEYDSTPSQSKRLTPKELSFHRDALYEYWANVAELVPNRGHPGVSKSEGASFVNGGLKHLARVDLFVNFTDHSAIGAYSIRTEYADEEEMRMSSAFVGAIRGDMLNLTFVLGTPPYPVDPSDEDAAVGKVQWKIVTSDEGRSLHVPTFGKNYDTMEWSSYTMELKEIKPPVDAR